MSIPDAGTGTLSAERRAYELLDFMGLPWDDPAMAMYRAAAIRNFREHARDQRHLCAEAVNDALEDMEHSRLVRTDAHVAVMNAPEPGKHNG